MRLFMEMSEEFKIRMLVWKVSLVDWNDGMAHLLLNYEFGHGFYKFSLNVHPGVCWGACFMCTVVEDPGRSGLGAAWAASGGIRAGILCWRLFVSWMSTVENWSMFLWMCDEWLKDQIFKSDMQTTKMQWTGWQKWKEDKIMQDLKRWDEFSDLKFVNEVYGCREDDGSEPGIQLKAG